MKNATPTSTVRNASVITQGSDVYILQPTSDGRGVNVQNAKGNLFVPSGQIGADIAKEILRLVNTKSEVSVAPVKRVRRTAEQIRLDAEKALQK